MATIKIQLKPFLLSLIAVCAVETVVGVMAVKVPVDALLLLGIARIAESVSILLIFSRQIEGAKALGIAPDSWGKGLIQGLAWSAGFALAAAMGFVGLYFAGIDPFALIQMRLPPDKTGLMFFFLAGGLISPVAEELFFRGVLYGYCRRWGFWPALLISTAAFVAAHASGHRLPVTQTVGGVVFGFAYEKTGRLTAPVTIHALGNLAIFTLSAAGIHPGPG